MTYLRRILLFVLASTSICVSQVTTVKNIANIHLDSVTSNLTSIYPAEGLPLSFLPEDLAIDNHHNIYIVERTTLRIVKVNSGGSIINELTINDTSMASTKEAKELMLKENKRPLNLKIAVDAEENVYVLLLNAETFDKMLKFDKNFNIDKSFILQGPVPGHRVIDFFISPQKNILVRTFPVVPVGHEQYIKEGLVFTYTTDGTFIGRNDPQNTYCNTISQLRNKFLQSNLSEDILTSETYSFIKINAAGEIFAYGVKNYGTDKPERNKKYSSKYLGYKVLLIEGWE